MKRSENQRRAWFLGAITLLLLSFFVVFELSALVLRLTGWRIPGGVLAVIDPALSILLVGYIGNRLSRRAAFKSPFDEIKAALERIARGDFAIHVEDDNPQLRDLVATVNHMAAELGQMETLRQEFVANVSHEIQSPLTSIRGFAQALRDERVGAGERTAYLEIIEAESARLSHLADNLLMLANLESAGEQLELAPFRLDKQIRTVILACEPQWQAKAIDWDIRLDMVTIRGHKELLGQVWVNLLQNAIKFSHSGGTIEVDLATTGEQVLVRITDHGIGIAEADQRRIFERFYKADKARDRSLGGNGLGLPIARKIVLLHGGAISVESAPGAGATFSVTLSAGVAAE